MFQRSGPWLYVASGAAIGLVAWGARARMQRRRQARDEVALPPADTASKEAAPSTTKADRSRKGRRSVARHREGADIPDPMRESLAASARSHGQQRPVQDNLAQNLTDRAERKGSHRRPEEGLEVSSLVSPIALASAVEYAGSPLRDPEALEVPLGQSADPEIDALLTDDDTASDDSTGAALRSNAAMSGVHEAMTPRQKRIDEEVTLTARPSDDTLTIDDAYDAVAPDDLGTEWLNRATESAATDPYRSAREALPPELMLESAMSGVSEGSVNAATADRLEGNASAKLEEDLDIDSWEPPPEKSGRG